MIYTLHPMRSGGFSKEPRSPHQLARLLVDHALSLLEENPLERLACAEDLTDRERELVLDAVEKKIAAVRKRLEMDKLQNRHFGQEGGLQ